jgi:hypothetical protein
MIVGLTLFSEQGEVFASVVLQSFWKMPLVGTKI